MPIRINILAAQQALEEMRRRDPVKRAVWVGAVLVALLLIWSSSLLAKSMLDKGELIRVQSENSSHEEAHRKILDNQTKLSDINFKLAALHRISTNRFLLGNLLNTLQQGTVSEVQMMRLRVGQSYAFTEEVKEVKGAGDKPTPAKPATYTEKINLTIDAKDTSAEAGGAVSKYLETLSELPYFKNASGKPLELKLTRRDRPMPDLGNRLMVLFTLECSFPDKTR